MTFKQEVEKALNETLKNANGKLEISRESGQFHVKAEFHWMDELEFGKKAA